MDTESCPGWMRLIRLCCPVVMAAFLIAGCASPQSVELATEMARAVKTYQRDAGIVLDRAHDDIVALRTSEEKQWDSLIAALDAALGEYEPILNALEQDPPPPYLAHVSAQTQQTYRQRLQAEQQLTRLVEFTQKQQERFTELKGEVDSVQETLGEENVPAQDVKKAKRRLAGVYARLMEKPVLPTTRSLDEPNAYGEDLADVRDMGTSYAAATDYALEYYGKWGADFAERLAAFQTRMDALTEELRTKVEQLKAEKTTLEAHRKAFAQAVDNALKNLAENREALARSESATSDLTAALVESVRHDVQIATIVKTALDVGLRMTTGLSLAGVINERDGQRISTLISTAGEVAGIVRGTADWETRQADNDAKKLGVGSDLHG